MKCQNLFFWEIKVMRYNLSFAELAQREAKCYNKANMYLMNFAVKLHAFHRHQCDIV